MIIYMFKVIHHCLQMCLKFFRNKCIGIYELDPAHFLSARGLTWQACFKKTRVKLKSLTNNYKLMMIEKGVRGGICHAIYRYAKVNNKYLKNYNKKIELLCLIYLYASNLYGWEMLQKLPVNSFKWNENI